MSQDSNNLNRNNSLPSENPCAEFTADYLQRYFRRKLFAQQVSRLEQHIMSCNPCLNRLNALGNQLESSAQSRQSFTELSEIKEIVEFLKSRPKIDNKGNLDQDKAEFEADDDAKGNRLDATNPASQDPRVAHQASNAPPNNNPALIDLAWLLVELNLNKIDLSHGDRVVVINLGLALKSNGCPRWQEIMTRARELLAERPAAPQNKSDFTAQNELRRELDEHLADCTTCQEFQTSFEQIIAQTKWQTLEKLTKYQQAHGIRTKINAAEVLQDAEAKASAPNASVPLAGAMPASVSIGSVSAGQASVNAAPVDSEQLGHHLGRQVARSLKDYAQQLIDLTKLRVMRRLNVMRKLGVRQITRLTRLTQITRLRKGTTTMRSASAESQNPSLNSESRSPLSSSAQEVRAIGDRPWRPGRMAAGIAGLLLAGAATYFLTVPAPESSTEQTSLTQEANTPRVTNGRPGLHPAGDPDLDFPGQIPNKARPLTPELIKEIETLVKNQASDQAQKLLTPALQQAELNNDRISQSRLLYLQGRIHSQRAEFARAIVTLKQAIEVAKSLNKVELFLSPEITLANIYHLTDQNAESATHASRCLALARSTNNSVYEVASLQMLGLSDFLAYRSATAEQLLKESITLSEKYALNDRLIYGHVYLGLIQTENKNFTEARNSFDKALTSLKLIIDKQRKNFLAAMISGYYARTQALSGNTKEAIALYNAAIYQANLAGIQQRLALSQMYQGLAECYVAQGNKTLADEKATIGGKLEAEAVQFCESSNTALSFAVVRKAAKPCN